MTTFTAIHVLLSLIGIASGLVVLYGLITANSLGRWTLLFIATTLATSLTGFFFPFHGFTPAIGVGIVSVLILGVVITARYGLGLSGGWRSVYVIGAVAALYFNSFVLVAQAFLKIPALHVLAPTGAELPFVVAQALVLGFYLVAGWLAVRGFKRATLNG
jgi:hypothetical protein